MKGSDLHLFIQEPHTALGRLLFRSVDLVASAETNQYCYGVCAIFNTRGSTGPATVCQYMNRVGHHRGRKPAAAHDKLRQMPLTHWEAELAVATSQYLLTYALRLKLETG